MAHALIYVAANTAGVVSGFRLTGEVRVAPDEEVFGFETADIPWDSTPNQVNQAVHDAAIAAAVVEELEIDGVLDVRTIVGGAAVAAI